MFNCIMWVTCGRKIPYISHYLFQLFLVYCIWRDQIKLQTPVGLQYYSLRSWFLLPTRNNPIWFFICERITLLRIFSTVIKVLFCLDLEWFQNCAEKFTEEIGTFTAAILKFFICGFERKTLEKLWIIVKKNCRETVFSYVS